MESQNNTIDDLESKVDQLTSPIITENIFTTETIIKSQSIFKWFFIKIKSNIIYILIPIIIFIYLLIKKPALIMSEIGRKGNKIYIRLSFRKLLFWNILLSLPFIIGIYVYFYRKKCRGGCNITLF